MKYIVYGVGAVGAVVGAHLHAAGAPVVFVARGRNLEELRAYGLRLKTPAREMRVRIEVVEHPREIAFAAADRVLVTVKTQDSAQVFDALAQHAPAETNIVCIQNGVANEERALRYFDNVFGAMVLTFAVHDAPGAFACHTLPPAIVDIGRWNGSICPLAEEIASDLRRAGLVSSAVDDIARLKRGKLVRNTSNALRVLTSDADAISALAPMIVRESQDCLRAAGLSFADNEEANSRLAELGPVRPTYDGGLYVGNSTQQSFERGGSLEVDFLNGEIARLGRQIGFEATLNRRLQVLARVAASAPPPRSRMDGASVRAAMLRTLS